MKKNLLLAFTILLCFVHTAFSQTNVAGNITSNTTWTKANSPYILTGNVGVPAAYTLTIEPGVTVQRSTDYQIVINGVLKCSGSATDSIVFSSGINVTVSNNFFLEFQKNNLSQSTLRFITFRNASGKACNLRVGLESESVQASIKNSGILSISRSNLSYGYISTNGYDAAKSLNIDSSLMISGFILGNYPRTEAIKVTNSSLYNLKYNK